MKKISIQHLILNNYLNHTIIKTQLRKPSEQFSAITHDGRFIYMHVVLPPNYKITKARQHHSCVTK